MSTSCARAPPSALRFRPAPQTTWAVEATGVRLLDLAHGRSCFLGYPEAALWDLVARGSPPEHVLRVWDLLAPARAPLGEEGLRALLLRWREEGFLEDRDRDG